MTRSIAGTYPVHNLVYIRKDHRVLLIAPHYLDGFLDRGYQLCALGPNPLIKSTSCSPRFTPHAKQGTTPTAWAAKLETKKGPYGPIPQASAAFTREGHN
jgi:hypothetical protein